MRDHCLGFGGGLEAYLALPYFALPYLTLRMWGVVPPLQPALDSTLVTAESKYMYLNNMKVTTYPRKQSLFT